MNKIKRVIFLLFLISLSFAGIGQDQKESSETKDGVIQLEDTIRASREQPRVLSIVPWQPPKDKEQLPSPFVKRIEQDFLPLDRDEFRRRVQHFEKVSDK